MVRITPRDKLLLQMLAKGKTSPELAICLDITDVDSPLAELFARIGATSEAQAVAIARKRGLLEPDADPSNRESWRFVTEPT